MDPPARGPRTPSPAGSRSPVGSPSPCSTASNSSGSFQDSSGGRTPPAPPSNVTLVFVDWDGTILPTKWLIRRAIAGGWFRGDGLPSASEIRAGLRPKDLAALAEADAAAAAGLDKIAADPTVHPFILTLAGTLWLCKTAEVLIPQTAKVLLKHQIALYPARELGKDRIMRLFTEEFTPRLVVSLGDGPLEREAVRSLPKTQLSRSVRFSEHATPTNLSAQWTFVRERLPSLLEISTREPEVDLHVSRRV